MIRRKHVFTQEQIIKLAGSSYQFVRTINLAGTVSQHLCQCIVHALDKALQEKKKTVIFVRGEDDLAVLPVVLSSPLESLVYYGQPAFPGLQIKPGMVEIVVTEEKKRYIKNLLNLFTQKKSK